MTQAVCRALVLMLLLVLAAACSTRQVQDSLTGATAQQLVSHGIDDMMRRLPASDFADYAGQRVRIHSQFLGQPQLQRYADERLALELLRRFDLKVADDDEAADVHMSVFYTALGTDQDQRGFFLPVGSIPGVAADTQINLISLQQFHGVAEMYYFIGPGGAEKRGPVLQARTRTDALGLPIITIPISNIDRAGKGSE